VAKLAEQGQTPLRGTRDWPAAASQRIDSPRCLRLSFKDNCRAIHGAAKPEEGNPG
jgi:hypothetical protein